MNTTHESVAGYLSRVRREIADELAVTGDYALAYGRAFAAMAGAEFDLQRDESPTPEPLYHHLVDTTHSAVAHAKATGTPLTAMCGVRRAPLDDPLALPCCRRCDAMAGCPCGGAA